MHTYLRQVGPIGLQYPLLDLHEGAGLALPLQVLLLGQVHLQSGVKGEGERGVRIMRDECENYALCVHVI